MKKTACFLTFALLGIFFCVTNTFSQGTHYKVTATIEIGGEGKWDYLSIDESMQRLYVSHDTKVHVIDLKTNKIIGTIEKLNGVHGIAFASEFNKGFITNGKSNAVTVFDLKTLKTLTVVQVTGEKPDAIAYDPFTKRIFAFNGGTKNATAIDAKSNSIVGTVSLGGSPEFSISDGKGKMFVNLEDENAVQEFDPKTLKVNSTWKLAPCEKPTGLAFDSKNKILFVGGRNKLAAIVNAENGKVITTLPIGAGVDACAYDPQTKMAFCSNREGTITVIKEDSKEGYKVIGNIQTLEGARTMALDMATHNIYASTIVLDKSGKKTFGVLVLENK